MSRRQFYEDVRRAGRGSIDGSSTPRGRSGSGVAGSDMTTSSHPREGSAASPVLSAAAAQSVAVNVEDLYTPLRHPLEGRRDSHSASGHSHPNPPGIATGTFREDTGGIDGASPTPVKQYPTSLHPPGAEAAARSRSNTVPYYHGGLSAAAAAGGPAGSSSSRENSTGGRDRSGSNAGVPYVFPIAQQQQAASQAPSSSRGEVSNDDRSRTEQSQFFLDETATNAGGGLPQSYPAGKGITSVPEIQTPGSNTTAPLPLQADEKSLVARGSRSPGAGSALTENTPFQSALDTPDHRDPRLLLSRRIGGSPPYTPPAEVRLRLDDPIAQPDPSPISRGEPTGTSPSRERNGSVARIEGTLVALQMELASEKKNNIEAELTIASLRREVDVLKAENRALAAASAAAPTTSPARPTGAQGGPSEQYVVELEQRATRLAKALEAKQRELDDKDERVRLLEHKLADQLLMAPSVPLYYPSPQAQAAPPSKGNAVAGQALQRGEVRSAGGYGAADIPPTLARRPAMEAHVTANTSDLQPLSADGSRTAMESKLQARSASSLRGASPGATAPLMDGGLNSPHKRSGTATARRPSVRRRASSSNPPPAPSSARAQASPVPNSARPRAGSIRKGPSMSSQPRAASIVNDSFGRRGSAAAAPAPASARGVTRKNSTSVMLNSSVSSLPRHAPSPRADKKAVAPTPARRPSGATTAASPAQPRRPSVQRRGSAVRRQSGLPAPAGGGGHAFGLSSSVAAPPQGSASGTPPTTVTRAGNVHSVLYHQPPALRSMMGAQRSSPARSATASLRSGASTRSRPRITYDERGDLTSMQGTTTTVVFRSSSTSNRPMSVPPAYTSDYNRMRLASKDAPLVPQKDATDVGGDGSAVVSSVEGTPLTEAL